MKSSSAVLAALLVAAAQVPPCLLASLTPELQKKVEAATFEVVLRKPEKETITYEKPLPLELIPYAERTDAYWSVGTAFVIAPNTFVTAAHVIAVGVASQFGLPAVRATDGKVFVIDKVVKFAAHEDYAVFTVSGAPPTVPFDTNTSPEIDQPIFAVGNALGEGVVVRDGLLTSRTPEQQDGRWKWLRFSAAASPGNSGGPLLDSQGRVLGIVIAKSPSENLNFASPIELVLNGAQRASFDIRQSFGLPPVLQGTIVAEMKDAFALPLPYAEFARSWRAAVLRFFKDNQAKLLASQAEQLFPQGQSARLLAKLYHSPEPSLVQQDQDHSWDAHTCSTPTETPLPGDGRIWFCPDGLFRVQYPFGSVDEHRYADSRAFMDLFLKGFRLPRTVGGQAVRITSLGAAQQDSMLKDRFGRQWQHRVWSLGYADYYVHMLALPTPDGYVGLVNVAPSVLLDTMNEAARFFADYLYVSYQGTLAQWQAFLGRSDLRPTVLDHVKLQYEMGNGLRFDSQRIQLDTNGVLKVSADSSLELRMTYLTERGALAWDIGGVVVNRDRDGKTYLAAYRQPKPGDDAGKEARERWEHMRKHDADYSGTPGHDDQYKTFWIRTVAAGEPHSDDATRPLYEVVYSTNTSVLPRQMEDIREQLAKDLRVTE
jgi:serine protease Do